MVAARLDSTSSGAPCTCKHAVFRCSLWPIFHFSINRSACRCAPRSWHSSQALDRSLGGNRSIRYRCCTGFGRICTYIFLVLVNTYFLTQPQVSPSSCLFLPGIYSVRSVIFHHLTSLGLDHMQTFVAVFQCTSFCTTFQICAEKHTASLVLNT